MQKKRSQDIVAKNIIKYCIDGSFRLQLRPLKPVGNPKDPTGRRVGLRPTHFLLPFAMSAQEQGFDLALVFAGCQFLIPKALRQIERGVAIGVIPMPTHNAVERLLVRSIGSIWVVTTMALLRGVGGFDRVCRHPAPGGRPGDLVRDVC